MQTKMTRDWETFYKKNKAPVEPSPFAFFVLSRNLYGQTLVDLGSGNGRDTMLLSKIYHVMGIDPNYLPEGNLKATFMQKGWGQAQDIIVKADIVYSRFFLHTITWNDVKEIIKLTPKYFCAEARAVGDQPIVYPEHERYYVDGNKLLKELDKQGFEILFYETGRDLARYKKENPLVIRVIALRIK